MISAPSLARIKRGETQTAPRLVKDCHTKVVEDVRTRLQLLSNVRELGEEVMLNGLVLLEGEMMRFERNNWLELV